jgi:periplasmic copper chaperone A
MNTMNLFAHLRMKRSWATALALMLSTGASQAQTTVAEPWVRGTVAQQKATGMFAQITSAKGGKLVSASSPVAGLVEIQEMLMDLKQQLKPGDTVAVTIVVEAHDKTRESLEIKAPVRAIAAVGGTAHKH